MKKQNNEYNIYVDNIAGKETRYILIKSKKHFFVSDLVNSHGKAFVSHAGKNITKTRVKDSQTKNSQMRRLITASGLQQANKAAATKKKVSTASKKCNKACK